MNLLNSIRTLAVALLFSIYNVHCYADSPVWEITKGENTLFIGGTIHLLSEQDYPLPAAFDKAFSQTDDVVFETDIQSLSSLSTQAKMMSVLMYQNGETIKSELSSDTYQSLVDFLSARNLPLTVFERFTPAGLNATLVVLELQRLGITGEKGVEAHFNSRAATAQKEIAWLEEVDEQIQFINKMNDLDADLLISSTIRDISKLEQEWPKLLKAWRTGDLSALTELGINAMIEQSPELYDFILAARNKRWLPEIKAMLETPDIEFVLVGALHLAGTDGLLSMLEADGYQIKQMQ